MPKVDIKRECVLVVPAYNEEQSVGGVVKGLREKGFSTIVVIDDGSADHTYEVAKKAGATVLRHMINRGLGGALGTGVKAALLLDAPYIITCDADGQHDPDDVMKLAQALVAAEEDVVIGSRLINSEGMPAIRRIGNQVLNIATFLLFGKWVTDSQSGLRGFKRHAAELLRIETNRMEVSSEIIFEIKRNNLSLKEIPIKAIYTDYSLAGGQSHLNGFVILFKLFVKKLFR